MTTISVIITAPPGTPTLNDAIQSALNQRLAPSEIIVATDQATRGKSAAMSGFEGAIQWHPEPATATPGAIRNRAAAAAQGHWLAFLDGRDAWAPEKLAQQIEALTNSGHTWSYTAVTIQSPTATPTQTNSPGASSDLPLLGQRPSISATAASRPLTALLSGHIVYLSSTIISRAAFFSSGAFTEQAAAAETDPLWFRLAQAGPADAITEPLTIIRMRQGTLAQRYTTHLAALAALDTARTTIPLPWHLQFRARRTAAHWHAQAGSLARQSGDPQSAQHHAQQAIALNPLFIHAWLEWLQASRTP
jgi:glycosyltransferase involved in cell wall biosynthesis